MLQKLRNFQPAVLVLTFTTALTAVFAIGIGTGFFFYPEIFAEHDDHELHDDHDHALHGAEEDHDHADHVGLTLQAYQNLGLRMGKVSRGDYWKSILIPAEIAEIPGRSDLSISAPVTGVVKGVRVLPGESVVENQILFQLQITDEELAAAQSKLLAALSRQDVIAQEVERLKPFIQSGAVPGNRMRELEYESKQLDAEKRTLAQQLLGRGLPESMIDAIFNDRQLATTIDIVAPNFVTTPEDQPVSGYSIENLVVHPGKAVQRGETLCSLAYHTELYVEGTAFESDLEVLDTIAANNWPIRMEAHHQHGEHVHMAASTGLSLLRIDNHVDETTQTVRFYVKLANSVERNVTDASGKLFTQWRYRPGQRVHLRLPEEQWNDQLMLPIDAVVVDGPNAYVFAHHDHDGDHDHGDHDHHDHAKHDDHAHDHEDDHAGHDHSDAHPGDDPDDAHGETDDHGHDIYVELEPIPVRLLHRDDKIVVLSKDSIPPGTTIALNHAHKLHLAMKMQSGGGGGHSHDH